MKRLALCVLVLCVLALPGISLAQSVVPVPPTPVLPTLDGTWHLTLTGIAPNGTALTSETAVLTLHKPVKAGFYTGSISATGTAKTGDVTLVQEGADVRFTISTSGKTAAWGNGLAGKNKMDLQWTDDAGVTGIGTAAKQ